MRGAADDRPVLDLAAGSAPLPSALEDPRGLAPEGPDPALATVDGVEVHASEVTRYLLRFNPVPAVEAMNQLLDDQMLEADAAAAGLVLPTGEIEARTEEEVRNREKDIRIQFGPEVSLERYLRDRFGTTVDVFRRETAGLVRRAALRDRLARWEAMREDSVQFRVLVTDSEEKARDAAASLRAGADFLTLAKRVSVAPIEEMPPYRRREIPLPALSDEIFAMSSGEISRPVRIPQEGKDFYWVFKIVEKRPGRDVPYTAAAAEIEKGLAARPLSAAERLQWGRRARERHGVKIHLVEQAR
jgi:parvulin-like peptidyl-prolyl isomerase